MTFPFADQSYGWKCDTHGENYTYPSKGPVSTYPYIHNTTNRAHVQRTFFYFWLDPFLPGVVAHLLDTVVEVKQNGSKVLKIIISIFFSFFWSDESYPANTQRCSAFMDCGDYGHVTLDSENSTCEHYLKESRINGAECCHSHQHGG